jgi:microcystin degradation protein MlrC
MKFVIALIRHETNTFSPVPTQLSDFRRGTTLNGPAYGDAARMACEGTNSAAAAYLDLARDMGADVDFAVCANAVPSGLVTREAFEHLCDTVVHSAQQGCDAILLDLHGAMVVDGYADAEGELLRRLRACTPAGLPIGVALDFHANFSRELIRHATAIAGYCTYRMWMCTKPGPAWAQHPRAAGAPQRPGAAVAPPAHADPYAAPDTGHAAHERHHGPRHAGGA